MVLTLAGVSESAAVESSRTGLAAPPLRVVHTPQTLAAAAVAASVHAHVNVAVTLARSARTPLSGDPCRVAIETLLTDITART